MTAAVRFLLDEHVSRVFERVLRERDFVVEQAKDLFGEQTSDSDLLEWCAGEDAVLISNDAEHFEALHRIEDHAGILLYVDQTVLDDDPESMARTVEAVLDQYGAAGLANEVVYLDDWYEWLQR